MLLNTANDESVQCGYIKMKFVIIKDKELGQQEAYSYACTLKNPRVTRNFIYVALGHDDIRDNAHARDIIETCLAVGGRITRLDFFVDYEGTLNFDALYAILDTKQPPYPSLLKSPHGKTLYCGKRASPYLFRCYDKRKEIIHRLKVDIGYELTRLELECKRVQIAHVLTLFMSRQTSEILNIIQEKYKVRNFCKRTKMHKGALPTREKSDPMAIVYRYRQAIRAAYLKSPTEFYDCIGVQTNGLVW